MCGIGGIISTKKTEFNINHFNILGTLNDERGGDSCGIFIDGQYKYGINDKKQFRNFTLDVKYPQSASIALLHCRKASNGYAVNLNQAQPVIITRDNQVKFVLMHNGTIYNINALATKYVPELKTTNMSDSQILAEIIYKCGYNVLGEYTGSAALVMVDYRSKTPEIFMFKGSSCYNDQGTDCERPLMYMIENNKFYFSSMYSSLYCIDYKNTIYDFPTNQLCKIENNQIYLVKDIDRTALKQDTYFREGFYYNSTSYITYNDALYYSNITGMYIINGAPAHGKYIVYPSGYLLPAIYVPDVKNKSNTLYFFQGRLLYNKACYDFLESINDLFEDTVLSVDCPEIIDYFAYSPRIMKGSLMTVEEDFKYVKYMDGSYVTLFNNSNKIEVKGGIAITRLISSIIALETFNKDTKDVYFNFDELEKQVISIIAQKLTDQDDIQQYN